MDYKKFGALLRERREASEDPATGAPYTQERLGVLLGELAPTTISSWERGDTKKIRPEHVNGIARILPVTVTELVMAMGYDLDQQGLQADERELLAFYRRLQPFQRDAARRVVAAMRPPSQAEPPRSRPHNSSQ